jgi:membrane-bound lytic murein transglycosylase B
MIILLIVSAPALAGSAAPAAPFNDLRARLSADGFTPDHLDRVYTNPEVTFDTRSVTLFFMHSESRLNYDQFTDKRNIRRARAYMQQHAALLDQAEKRFGTDKEIITAIILVETKLGTYLGKSFVLNTLSTLAALEDPALRQFIWSQIPQDRRISQDKFEKRAQQKSQWAYKELKALLTYTQKEGLDAPSIRGSYAGAMGISQFMPTNALTLAKDGNQDGRVDLFDHADAIMSVANYLKHHGWHQGIEAQKAYKVILRYNYSKYYANTILKIAEILKS